jgi:hypothetical protein
LQRAPLLFAELLEDLAPASDKFACGSIAGIPDVGLNPNDEDFASVNPVLSDPIVLIATGSTSTPRDRK